MKLIKNLLIGILIGFIPFFLPAQTDYDALFDDTITDTSTDIQNENTDTPAIPDFKLALTGEHAFAFHIPVIQDHLDFKGNIKAPRFTNELGIELTYKILKLVSYWQLDLKLNEFGKVEDVLLARPQENKIIISPWKFIFGVGYQTYKWGTADGINPTDNLNPHDYSTGLESEKLPLLSASAAFYPIDFMSMEVVYAPFEQSDNFPVNIAEKIPPELFYALTNLLFISAPPLIAAPILTKHDKLVDINKLNYDPSSFLIGGKLNFFFRYVDFSFSCLYDVDPYYTPVITMEKNTIMGIGGPIDGNPLGSYYRIKTIDLTRKRIIRIGTDLKATVDRFGIWAEFCYSLSEDYQLNSYKIRNHTMAWVIGFDFNYGPNNDFYFNLQYLGEFVPLYDQNFYKDYTDGRPDSTKTGDESYMEEYYYRMLTNSLGNINAGLRQGLSLNMKWPVLDSLLTPSLSAAYIVPIPGTYDYEQDARYGSLALNPELDIMPIDSFHIRLGAQLFYSWHKLKDDEIDIDYNDDLGIFYNDSNIYIEVAYKWNYEWRK